MAILAFDSPHHLTAEEINHAEESGQQIALALWNVQQEADIQKRLQESDTLAKITRALSETERIGLQTVLQLIVTSAKELISSAEQAVIHLLDEEQQLLTAEAVVGYAENVTTWKLLKIRPNEGVAGLVIVSGETINIADISTDPRFLPTSTLPSYRSLMVAPLQSGERKLGTISVQSSLVNAFTKAESQLLSELGIQASIAIENTNLLERTKQSLKETNVLYHINQGLAASSFDPDQLMDMVVDILYNNFRYYHIHIYLIDPQSGHLVSRHGRGEAAQEFTKMDARLPVATGIIGHVAETRQPFITNNVNDVIFYYRHPLLPDTKSELAVPIMINGEALGVLDVKDRSNIPPHHLSMMSAIANQLAVALQKANLYAELQKSLEQEKTTRNQLVQNERLAIMGRLLASVSHELNNPLQAIQNALFLLKEEKGISTQGQQDLNIVLAESERMGNMIEQLRATYRPIQAEDFHPTQMNEIIEAIHALISPHLRHNQIAFEFHPEPELPAIPALSDQIRQVVLNLLMNAVEAMPTGGNLTVGTKLLEDTNEILLTVSDTGSGISSAILPNIFEAFVTNKQQGTGLGLTITYDIVIKHRGRISAENDKDHGAIFKVWLPTKNREIS
jgi:signal transduction histidine kinase